jgi:hypothetical protein
MSPSESVSCTVKDAVPTIGVPEITPSAGEKLNPKAVRLVVPAVMENL